MGWEHNLDRWDPYLQELLALKADILATQFIVRAQILRETLRKANFDPNQPRSPAGSPNGGQWTREGGDPSSGLPGAFRRKEAKRLPVNLRRSGRACISRSGPPTAAHRWRTRRPFRKHLRRASGRNFASHAPSPGGLHAVQFWATRP